MKRYLEWATIASLFLAGSFCAGDDLIKVRPAIELELVTESGKLYALQSTTNLTDWMTEETVMGTEEVRFKLQSVRGLTLGFFRLVEAPKVNQPLVNQTALIGQPFTYSVPIDAFLDSSGGELTIAAEGQSGGSLPGWLQFDAVSGAFSGVPAEGDAGVVLVVVTSTNRFGAGAVQKFVISVVGPSPAGFVVIPAGDFEMGDPLLDGTGDERPLHSVYVSAFLMKATEVTRIEWDLVLSWAESHGYDISPEDGVSNGSNHPVHSVSWIQCVKYCNARSEMEGLNPAYKIGGNVFKTGSVTPVCDFQANGYRLPTEAEWEKAARGGVAGLRFPWGNTISHTNAIFYGDSYYKFDRTSIAGYHPQYGYYTSPVARFAPNGYGVYDVVGNVWEWCNDYADSEYYAISPRSDPQGPVTGAARIIRGGAWGIIANLGRLSCRENAAQDEPGSSYGIGFRVVKPIMNP